MNNVYVDNFGPGFGKPTSLGAFVVSFQYFGIVDFNQLKFGLTYASTLSEKLPIEIHLDMICSRFNWT